MATEDPEPQQSEPHPQTLAAGELVWAKTKGRHHWWPARLHAPFPSAEPPLVSSLGAEYSDDHRPAAAVKPFLSSPDADALARANTGLAFFAAVAHARATAVGILCDALTCHCARGPHPPPPPPADEAAASKVVITGVANLEPREFLAALGSAAVDAPGVGLLDHARLKSWVRALAQGWGPDGPGRYQRRTEAELADKIDLDILAEDGAASEEEEEEKNKPVAVPHKTPKQRRRRSKAHPKEESEEDKAVAHKTPKQRRRRTKAHPKEEKEEDKAVAHKMPKQRRRSKASLMESDEEQENLSAGEEEGNASSQRQDESGTALSGRRERKKSKYLSPPYTNIGVFALEDKSPDSPKKSPPTSTAKRNDRKNNKGSPEEKQQQKKNKVVPPPPLDSVGAHEVLLLVRCFGEDVSHKRHFPKAAEDFLGLLRSSVFAEGADHDSYKKHECPVARTAVADSPIAGLVSDSAATPKEGKGKRGRKKKDQDGSGDSSVKKKKKTEKTSPTAAFDCPAENASEKKNEEGVVKRGRKKKEQDGTEGSVIKRKKMDKTSPKATLGPGLVITPAIPIRQVSAEDIMSQVKPAGGAGMGVGVPDPKMKNNMLVVSKSPISSIMSGGVKSGEEQNQGDGGSVVNAGGALSDQPTKKNEEGTVEATELDTDMDVDTLDGDVAAGSAQAEAKMPETGGIQVDMNVECVGVVDVPVTSLQMEALELEANIPLDINVQVAAVEDVPAATSGLLPPTHGDVAQPYDGNKGNASMEACAVQESYTSLLKAMVPEMYKKVEEVAAGTGVVAAPQDEDEAKKVEEASQKKAVGDGPTFASHSSPAKGTTTTNGTPCPDAPNSAQKRRNKKPAAYFANPAEIRVTFRDGTIVPTKEELLSEFRRFGVLVESECDISEDRRDARVVFAKSTEAEAAYTKAEIPGIFGQFGPPFATLGLNYLEAITVAPARPAKPPLARADMRKNVENMISSLKNGGRSLPLNAGGGGPPVSESLLAEMQRLLSKLDKTQPPTGPSGSAPPSSS